MKTDQNIVAIDTSTNWAGAGLYVGAKDTSLERSWHSQQNHCSELIPTILELCEAATVKPQQISHVAVALGPGRFSAVRAGISSAIGLSIPNNIPAIGVPTHQIEALAHIHHANATTALFVVLPAGRGEVIWYKYNADFDVLASDLSDVATFAAQMRPNDLVCGEGAELLTDNVEQTQILTTALPSRSPANLIKLARQRIANAKIDEYHLKPIYAREPSITLSNR